MIGTGLCTRYSIKFNRNFLHNFFKQEVNVLLAAIFSAPFSSITTFGIRVDEITLNLVY